MADMAIQVENLGKEGRIGGRQRDYQTIRERVQDMALALFRRAGRPLRGAAHDGSDMDETIRALKDVSLEVRQGEVVGITGRNRAGKTTAWIVSTSSRPARLAGQEG